jgi:hypothetical protein
VASTLPKTDRSTCPDVEYTRVGAVTDWSSIPAELINFQSFHKCIPRGATAPKVFFVLHVKGAYYGEFRYSDLAKLHKELQHEFPNSKVPAFPSQVNLFTNLDSRMKSLELFLQDLVANSKLSKSVIVKSWLGYRAKVKDSSQPKPE